MRARSLPLLLAASALLAQGQPTFYAAYQDGLEAEQAGNWAAAAAAYRRAIELRPDPAARVIIYGNNLLTRYYPYTRLARCEMELGHREAAATALAQAAGRGEPAPERQGLQRRLEVPATSPRPLPAPPAPKPVPMPPPASARPAAPIPSTGVGPEAPAPAPAVQPPAPDAPSRPAPAEARRPAAGAIAGPAPIPPAMGAPPAPPPPARSAPRWAFLAGGAALLLGTLAWRRARRRNFRPSTPDRFPEPDRLGPYRLEGLLGRGGFASTYRARHEATGARVALKVLHPYRQDDEEFLRRFRQEARLGARLDHPNLVRILDPGPEAGLPYLAMELVEGPTLEARLAREGALPVSEACAIARDVARAMAHAHARGVVHRDLKPGNILLTPSGARVTDLGIARVVDAATVTTTYAFLGTPLYAAPEAQFQTHVGPAADRYSLGVILFHMLAGVPPFQGETPFQILDRHRTAPPPNLATLRPEVPPALATLVARLLAKDPDQRPEDGELCLALEALPAEPPAN